MVEDEIQFKQWTSTDRSNLEINIPPAEECVSLFIDKLERLLQTKHKYRDDINYLRKLSRVIDGTCQDLTSRDFKTILGWRMTLDNGQ